MMTSATVAAAKDAPFFENSRLMAIAINALNNNLIYRAQTKPNGPWETDWAWINKTNQYDIMVAGLARDGRVVVLAQARPTFAVHFYIETPDSTGGVESWEAPVNLGMPAGVPGFSQLLTCRGTDGKVNVFGVAKNTGYVWWIFQNPDRTIQETIKVTVPGQQQPVDVQVDVIAPPLTPWSAWQQLAAPPKGFDVMTAANNGDGTIALAGSTFYDATLHTYLSRQKFKAAMAPTDWTPWADMTQSRLDAQWPALRLDSFGSLNLFAIGGGSAVLHRRQLPANGDTFTPWAYPFMVGKQILEMATGIDGDGHIVVVAMDENAHIYANSAYDVPMQQWSGWQQIGSAFYVGPMTLEYNADGRLTLFQREGTGPQRLWCMSQIALNSSSWEANWTLLSNSALSRYGIVRDLTPPAA